MKNRKFEEAKHKRNSRGQFTGMPNSGQAAAAAAHDVDLTAMSGDGQIKSNAVSSAESRGERPSPMRRLLWGRTGTASGNVAETVASLKWASWKIMSAGRAVVNPRAAWRARQDRIFWEEAAARQDAAEKRKEAEAINQMDPPLHASVGPRHSSPQGIGGRGGIGQGLR